MKETVINGKTYKLENISGTVAEASKNIETKVSGGGGSINNGKGFISPTVSHTIVHDQIFIIDQQGRERSLEIQGMNVACRGGNYLTVTKLIRQNGNLEYIAAFNHTTESVFFNVLAINRLFEPKKRKLLLPSFIISVLPLLLTGWSFIGILVCFLFVTPLVFVIYMMYYFLVTSPKLGRKFMAEFRFADYE